MKLLIFALAAVFTVSCSSKKKVETAPAPEPVQEEAKKIEEPVEPVQTAEEAPPEEETAPSSSELPMIEGDSLQDVNCALGRDQRTISLLKRTDASGWGVVYEKFGNKKTIAVARNDKSFCDNILEKVKENLQSAGFQCDGESTSTATPSSGDSPAEQEKSMIDNAKDTAESAAEAAKDTTSDAAEAVKEGAADAVDKAKEIVAPPEGK